jgi:hypothetical protein
VRIASGSALQRWPSWQDSAKLPECKKLHGKQA